jgi:mRNA-degrading endonuclease RelE of RelBE toxin-antitoxin system
VIEFLIADTFTSSLARLAGQEQKAAKITAFDLQRNPANPGMHFHKVDRSRDPNFWSVRVNDDLRLIVHKTAGRLMLCYVGHHDDAYTWTERRRVERHPVTDAAQFVEVPTRIEANAGRPSIAVPSAVKPRLPATVQDSALLGYGVPAEWLGDVRAADEDTLFDLVSHLPAEAAEALIALAVGETPKPRSRSSQGAEPFSHPDARRRFRLVVDRAGLDDALKALPASRATVRADAVPTSLSSFQSLWADLRTALKPGTEIRGWGATRGFTSMRFEVADLDAGSITVSSPTMSAPRRVSKGEFAKLYVLWNDYSAGRVDRQAVTPISQNSSYIFAILRWHEDLRSAAQT